METVITCYARGIVLPTVSSKHSNALVSPPPISPSFSSGSFKSSSIFGKSPRVVPRSSLKVSKTKNSVTRSEIGDCLQSNQPEPGKETESNVSIYPGKNSWPELVGTNGEAAKKTIESENPNLNAIVVLDGTPATMDFRFDRVRVVVDEKGMVILTPTIG